jgi:protein tyrosine/serine phosphatase
MTNRFAKFSPAFFAKNKKQKLVLVAVIFVVAAGAIAFVVPRFMNGPGMDFVIENASKSHDKAVKFDKIANFREVILPGKIRAGVLMRSTRLSAATPNDVAKLANIMNGGLIIDLRSKWEVNHATDKAIPNVRVENFPIHGVGDAAGYVSAFVNDSHDRQNFANALVAISKTDKNAPILIHCTFGKDRTGWLVSLLMYLAGASDTDVMTEYLKSNYQMIGVRVDSSWLEAAVGAARAKYGSMEKYVSDGLKVSPATIASLRGKLSSAR